MNVLITGAAGFVGRNLVAALHNMKSGKDRTHPEIQIGEIYLYGSGSTMEELNNYCQSADFVFHLAGVNRPIDEKEYMEGNFGFSSVLLSTLKKHGNNCPVMLASSVQASLEGRFAGSEYGRSKRAGEDLFFAYARETGAGVLVYRFPNLFGKWCRPNYNSAIATFCYNTARGLPIQVNDPAVEMDLVYIDDLVEEMLCALQGKAHRTADGYCFVPVHYETTLGHIADTIRSFADLRPRLEVPQMDNPLTKKLYSTYLSHLPQQDFIYDLKMNCDDRGSFTEIIRTVDRGQFSVNVSKPGVTKGNHWHHTKNEKFMVVSGHGLIQLRQIGTDKIVEFEVSGDRHQVVEMIPGWTHNIINLSDTADLVTFMWANEPFDPEKPDTFFEKV